MASGAIVLAHERSFALGEGEAHPALLRLEGPQASVQVEPLAMSVLVALHRANGSVLSRDDLIRDCWDGRVVGEDAINRVIAHLRRALASTGIGSSLETIPRVGFRLAPGDRAPPTHDVDRRRVLLVAGSALAAAAAGGVLLYRREAESLPSAARAAMDRGKLGVVEATDESMASANAAFREAAAIAPSSAQPWGMLAFTYANIAFSGDPSKFEADRRRARAAADRALAIDPDNGPAKAATIIMMPSSAPLISIDEEIAKARRTNPDDPCLANLHGYFYGMVGRLREALPLFRTFEDWAGANPRTWSARANHLASLGREDEADLLFTRALDRWPRNYIVWFPRFKFLMYSGRAERALAMLDDRPNRPVGISDYNFDVCRKQALACASRSAEAVSDGLAASLESAQRGHGYAENAMMFASHVGRLDEAFSLADGLMLDPSRMPALRFDKVLARYANRPRPSTTLLFMPAVASMRRDPRIERIYVGSGLRDYWRKAGVRSDVA